MTTPAATAMGRSGRQVVHVQDESARQSDLSRGSVRACGAAVRSTEGEVGFGVCAKPPGIFDCFSDCRNCIVVCIPCLGGLSLRQVLCRPVPRLCCASAHGGGQEAPPSTLAHARDTRACAWPHAARRSMTALSRHLALVRH